MVFEFPDERRQKIMLYLGEREGKDFVFASLPVELDDGGAVQAVVSIYRGQNVMPVSGSLQIAKMAIEASGKDGSCTGYIEGVADQLRLLHIDDPIVKEVFNAVVKLKSARH